MAQYNLNAYTKNPKSITAQEAKELYFDLIQNYLVEDEVEWEEEDTVDMELPSAIENSLKKTNKKEVSISSKVVVDGVKYTVTRIEAKTFANAPKATKVTLPSTITSLGAQAFTGAKSLKTIVIKSKTTVKVNKDAFKNVDTKKMTIKVTQNMSLAQYKAFKKQLRAAGFKGTIKRVTVGK